MTELRLINIQRQVVKPAVVSSQHLLRVGKKIRKKKSYVYQNYKKLHIKIAEFLLSSGQIFAVLIEIHQIFQFYSCGHGIASSHI